MWLFFFFLSYMEKKRLITSRKGKALGCMGEDRIWHICVFTEGKEELFKKKQEAQSISRINKWKELVLHPWGKDDVKISETSMAACTTSTTAPGTPMWLVWPLAPALLRDFALSTRHKKVWEPVEGHPCPHMSLLPRHLCLSPQSPSVTGRNWEGTEWLHSPRLGFTPALQMFPRCSALSFKGFYL